MSTRRLPTNTTADYWEPGGNYAGSARRSPRPAVGSTRPAYRVYFWERQTPERADTGWTSDEWQLEDADIDEVLEWVQAKAASRRFVVYVEVTQGQPDDLGLVRLLGTGPTDPGDTSLMFL
jgi:hypothetical protein